MKNLLHSYNLLIIIIAVPMRAPRRTSYVHGDRSEWEFPPSLSEDQVCIGILQNLTKNLREQEVFMLMFYRINYRKEWD